MKLEGVKVLDLSAFLPGPHMTMMMADHGADVVMVEPDNGLGEPTRAIGETTQDGISVWFRNIARGKRSFKVNLKDKRGYADFMTLAKQADIIVEAFRPGVVTRLKVDYETIKAVNPKVVYCSISAFGQSGTYAQKPAHDLTIQAMAGLVDLNRGLDDKPASPNLPSADMAASLMAFSAIMMAMYRREKTGKGDYIDMSMYDALLAWTPNITGPVFANHSHPSPKDMRSFGGAAMYNIYETKDAKFIVLGGSEIKFAENLLGALGRPDLIEIAKTPPGPTQKPLRQYFRQTFLEKTSAEWQAFLAGVDCCWSVVRTLKEAFDDPFTRERGMICQDRDGNSHIGMAMKFADEPGKPRLKTPKFGEHTHELKDGF
ncbi:MAG TPA: CoA transferase [Hellea balneolensis]|uniref:CoA transferase n=1 Tax=Hellea balneolensis TaxID=287478 RepID=A0A7C5R0X1_9PROT|nr:CoA transferase [Hellea balneolensis]